MPLFDLVTIPSLLVMAAAPVCSMPKATEINVIPSTAPIVYDYSKNLRAMQHEQVDTVNPYDYKGPPRTQGLMSGSLKIEPKVHIAFQTMPSEGVACLWYDKIDISLSLKPTILLAQEVYHDPCMRKAVLEHEMKHVSVDRALANKYAQLMGQEVYRQLEARGFSSGPMPVGEAEQNVKKMQDAVFQIIAAEFSKMEQEQGQAQQLIDSREEYDRVNNQCPKFHQKYAVRKAYGDD